MTPRRRPAFSLVPYLSPARRGLLRLALLAGFLVALSAAIGASRAGAEEVDVQLVLAADISLSMDNEELRVQREAYAAAFRDRLVREAIRNGPAGRVAVAFVEWSGMGDGEQTLVVPWMVLSDDASAEAFAQAIEAAPVRRGRRTAIGDALRFSAALFDISGHTSPRRVIDVSGDGTSNEGVLVTQARDEVVARGIVINGLPLVLDRTGTQTVGTPDDPRVITLEDYYEACVIGGPGGFQIPVAAIEQMPRALRAKLIIEIADLSPPDRVLPAQAEGPPIDCNGRFPF